MQISCKGFTSVSEFSILVSKSSPKQKKTAGPNGPFVQVKLFISSRHCLNESRDKGVFVNLLRSCKILGKISKLLSPGVSCVLHVNKNCNRSFGQIQFKFLKNFWQRTGGKTTASHMWKKRKTPRFNSVSQMFRLKKLYSDIRIFTLYCCEWEQPCNWIVLYRVEWN